MQKIRAALRSAPFILGLAAILAYGLLIPWLGFYWDDWPFAFLAHFYGPLELVRAFAPFRPFLGPIFFLTTSLLGTAPFAWQMLGLVARFTTAFAFYWMLNQVWPGSRRRNLVAALFFLLFPGFSQQWVALTHINQEVLPLIAYLFSFGLTARAIRAPAHRIRSMLLAVVLQFVGLFATEYFIGFEIIRLLLIWYLVDPGGWLQKSVQTLRRWLPYGILLALNGVWLFIYYRSGSYASYELEGMELVSGSLSRSVGGMLLEGLHTLSTALFSAWAPAFAVFKLPFQSSSFLLAFALLVAAFAIFYIFFARSASPADDDPQADGWAGRVILLGVVAILAGRIPSWVAGLPFEVRYDYDRFFLSIMPGASLVVAGVLEYFLRGKRRKIVLTSLLLALALGAQFLNANAYRRDAENQKNLFTQLTWRAPGIQPGTILLTDHIAAIPRESDLGLTAPLNWVYAPDLAARQIPYVLLYTDIRLATGQLPGLARDIPVEVDYRTTHFSGNTSNTLVFFYPEVGCIRVVDPANPLMLQEGVLPANLARAAKWSNLSRINPAASPAALPAAIFGAAAAPDWCYYYQKAELARQSADWNAIVRLGSTAREAGFQPDDPLEWLPFVEGSLRSGSVKEAQTLLRSAFKPRSVRNDTVCLFLQQMAAAPLDAAQAQFIADNRTAYACEEGEQ